MKRSNARGEALPFPFPLSAAEIQERRRSILVRLMDADPGFASLPVRSVRASTLLLMRDEVDRLFLCGFLRKTYGALPVSLSPRMTRAAGKFVYSRKMNDYNSCEIRLSSDFLFRLSEGAFQLNGLSAHSPQEAFLIVFEHEVIHAAEYALYGATGHSKRFLALAGGLFGHTKAYHALPTRADEAAASGLVPGRGVLFLYEGRTMSGVVARVGKTVTVMVPDRRGDYRDAAGRRYRKFRVSPGLLQLT
ncbi:MAG: hypothetical protein IJ573_06280 [Clostridia bacterium]|nr:hypothetical protein [Clostridia bacterium]